MSLPSQPIWDIDIAGAIGTFNQLPSPVRRDVYLIGKLAQGSRLFSSWSLGFIRHKEATLKSKI